MPRGLVRDLSMCKGLSLVPSSLATRSLLSFFLSLQAWNKVWLPPKVIMEGFMQEVCPAWTLVLGAVGR